MKKLLYYIPFIFVIIFFETGSINAQIPNGDFENWTNGILDSCIAFNVTKSDDKYSGNFAAKGIVDSSLGLLFAPGIIIDFPISKTYTSLTGFYKFTPMSPHDELSILVVEYKDNSTVTTAGGFLVIGAQTSSYKQFTLPIHRDSSTGGRLDIEITIVDSSHINPAYGSSFIIDDLQLSQTATGISDRDSPSHKEFELNQNYPNPFNPATTIQYSIPKRSFVTIKVYNVLGKEISTLVNERKAEGNYSVDFNAVNLPSGIYFYRMQAGKFSLTKKFVLLK
jgi:Secretion system C-terminal sorting domain